MTSRQEKAINLPGVVLALIALFAAIHLWRSYLPAREDFALLARFAFVPARLTFGFDAAGVSAAFNELLRTDPDRAQALRYFLGDGAPRWSSLITYAFLHGDWTHLGFNALWLAAFGSAVARRFGAARFLGLCAATAVGGALAHLAAHRFDLQPMIGASAAVSGTMAAAARFAFAHRGALGPGGGWPGEERHNAPALRLSELPRQRSAMMFLGVWFASNLIFGLTGQAMGLSDAPIAWEAHVGGFLVGLLAFGWFDPRPSMRLPQ